MEAFLASYTFSIVFGTGVPLFLRWPGTLGYNTWERFMRGMEIHVRCCPKYETVGMHHET